MATINQQSDRLSNEASPQAKEAKEDPMCSHINDKTDSEAAEAELPSHLAPIEALGIENWRQLEKKLVRRLDLTMMPCLWVSASLPHP